MPIKSLDRLMFAQGNLCFFCEQPLPKAEASVEHLFATANGGPNNDENCVACCKAVNSLLGSMSLKEKFKVVLNQKGKFKCPNGTATPAAAEKPKAKPSAPAKPTPSPVDLAISNLKQRGNSKPRTIKTLRSTIAALFPKGTSDTELDKVLGQLQSKGVVIVSGAKVTYVL